MTHTELADFAIETNEPMSLERRAALGITLFYLDGLSHLQDAIHAREIAIHLRSAFGVKKETT